MALAGRLVPARVDKLRAGDERAVHGRPQIVDLVFGGERYRALRGALGELVQFLDADNIQAFLDQPTQGFQDAYIAELHRFTDYGGTSSRAALDTIDGGMLWFKSVGIVLLVAMLAASAAIYAAARRAVVAPLEQAGRHFERIAQGRLDEAV
ncbi:Tar ligand binding domain-containing protein, partial [Burkholderia cenocepacia]|nr:Tar ligand binding domain-containing protein [Burkholderia cenocepacia]MDR5670932.1 Tar ligand binding domain-containing protein [Burkholderia cenocepacia]